MLRLPYFFGRFGFPIQVFMVLRRTDGGIYGGEGQSAILMP
jgi:hypothetical protein